MIFAVNFQRDDGADVMRAGGSSVGNIAIAIVAHASAGRDLEREVDEAISNGSENGKRSCSISSKPLKAGPEAAAAIALRTLVQTLPGS